MLRQHDGAVVGASDHEGVEQVFDGDGLARLDAEAAAAERRGVGAGLDRVGQRVASGAEVFKDEQQRHHLGAGGRVGLDVGVVLVEHLPRRGVDGERAPVRHARRDFAKAGHLVRRRFHGGEQLPRRLRGVRHGFRAVGGHRQCAGAKHERNRDIHPFSHAA